MPKLTELLIAEGVDLKGVDAEKLNALVEQSDQVVGLVAAKNDLHQWKETNKPIIEARETELAAQKEQAAADLIERERLAIENKDFKAQLEIQVEKENARNAEMAALKEANAVRTEDARKASHDSAVTKIQSLFNDATMGFDVATNRVSTKVDENGVITQYYNLGGATFDKFEDLQAAMVSNQSYSSMMKAPNSNGANSGGNIGGSSELNQKKSGATNSYLSMLNQ